MINFIPLTKMNSSIASNINRNNFTFKNKQMPLDHKSRPKMYDMIKQAHPIKQLDINNFTNVTKEKEPNQVRIVCFSDIHGRYHQIKSVPDGDILIIAGDLTMAGEPQMFNSMIKWLNTLPHKHKIIIAGNHDLTLQENWYENDNYKRWHSRGPLDYETARIMIKENENKDFIYLEDSSVTIEGIKIWGSPWSAFFHDWAFNIHIGEESDKLYSDIPDDVDVLITHGPPATAGDYVKNFYSSEHVGCPYLLKHITERIKPQLNVFGHIHEAYGVYTDDQTIFANASTCTLKYKATNLPIVVDVNRKF